MVVWKSDLDACWMPPFGGLLRMSDWKNTPGQTHKGGLCLPFGLGMPQDPRGGGVKPCGGKGCLAFPA